MHRNIQLDDVHYINLTNGLHCPHGSYLNRTLTPYSYVRIQSTACEQKRWDDVVFGAGPDLFMMLARGASIIVHDKSEKERETRAMWQGLRWCQYVAERTWGLPVMPILGRGGKSMQQYFDQQYHILSKGVKFVAYFGRFLDTDQLYLRSCYGS